MKRHSIFIKRYSITFLLLAIYLYGSGQVQNPVNWIFTSKKTEASTFEVHLTATIGKGWHTYSQTTPDGGPVGTTIDFTKNPLLTMDGPAKEVGRLEQHNEPLFGVEVKQFSDKVDFVQVVQVKKGAKTTLAGNITYMVCNDKECLPPSTMPFSISLK
jgi:DsbC/DsbD-like thiol-disulfide interchange protein